jgi:hypothetical protein
MTGSPPTTRRRRILNAVTSIKPSNYYSAVPSRSRQSSGKPSFFRPISDPSHQYQIQRTKDGSMISAVPIDEKRNLRSSPILFSDVRALNDSPSQKGSAKKQTWSRQGLLEARGKQRSKLKNRSDYIKDDKGGLSHVLPFKPSSHNRLSNDRVRRKDGKKRGQRWDLTQVSFDQQQVNVNGGRQWNGQIPQQRDDESFSSFPILSPTHKFDEVETGAARIAANIAIHSKRKGLPTKNGHATKTKSSPSTKATTKTQPITDNSHSQQNKGTTNPTATSTHSFQNLLQQRIHEIQSEQTQLLQSISKKEMIERTLISAIDENLIKNRRRISGLNKELEEIQWHLALSSKEASVPPAVMRGKMVSSAESIGDPSLTMIDSTNDSLLSARDMKRKTMEKAVTITGLDPPARSPDSLGAKKQDPMGPRISAVLRGEELLPNAFQERSGQIPISKMPIRPIRPVPKHLGVNRSGHQQQLPNRNVHQQQHSRGAQRPSNNSLSSRRIRSSFLNAANRRGMKKNVHFKLPDDEQSVELRFVNDSPSVDDFDMTHAMNGHRLDQNQKPNSMLTHPMASLATDEEIRAPTEANQVDDQSWQGSQYDIETFDMTTGNLITSEHYDTFQWKNKDHRLVTTEHYSRENHHNVYGSASQPQSAFQQYNKDNGGVSSDSVETDPDLSFIHAVAAVVIQTAVRRFLAEIRAMERLYAVQVIQTAICRWMVRRTDPSLHEYRVVRKGVSRMPSPVPSPKKKRDELRSSSYHDDATIIQRCWRGWWAREGIEVDHYAAMQIQRVFRGWWAREALEVDRYCAIEIQRVIRGYLGRMSYIYDLYCVIVAQSVARRYLAFYESAVRLANVLYIQAIYRGYRVRSELMRYVQQGQEVAATMIQAQYRSYDAQMNLINTLADILIVQSVARRWLVLKKLKRVNLQDSYQHGVRRQQQVSYNIHNNSVSRAIQNLQHYPSTRQHHIQQNESLPRWQSPPTHQSASNRPPMRIEPNSNARTAEYPIQKTDHHPDGFDTFNRTGSEEWFDGNKREASEMLTNWKRRSSRSTNS